MSKKHFLADISQKHEKNTVFEKNRVFLGKMALLANLSQKAQKKAFFEKNPFFLDKQSLLVIPAKAGISLNNI